MTQNQTTILGVRIDNETKEEALRHVLSFLRGPRQHTVFTPNPEILVAAKRDNRFQNILNTGSLNICDGKGISLVSKGRVERIPGVDFMIDICELAQKEGKCIYLLGAGKTGGPAAAAEALQKRFPNLSIVGFDSGPKNVRVVDSEITIDEEANSAVIDTINTGKPDILFVAFGHVKQEYWIHTYLKQLPSVQVAMGVGGALDFIGGTSKRAPKWVRYIGFEWLYRLMREPKRIGRIWNATAYFLYLHYFKST